MKLKTKRLFATIWYVCTVSALLAGVWLPMVTGSSYPMNRPLVMLGCATSVLGYYMYTKYWVN